MVAQQRGGGGSGGGGAGAGHEHREAGRQAMIQVQASPVNQDNTGDRSETEQHSVSACTSYFLTMTLKPIVMLFGVWTK